MSRPLFTQSWIHAETLAHHAWRVFFRCPAVTPDQMTAASHASWAACFKAYQKLTSEERMLIREFYRWKPELRGIVVHGEAESKAMERVESEEQVMTDNLTGMDDTKWQSEGTLTGMESEAFAAMLKSEACDGDDEGSPTGGDIDSLAEKSEATVTRFNHPITVYPALRKASRLWAIERGLADDVPDLPRDRKRR